MKKESFLNKENNFCALVYDTFIKNCEQSEEFLKAIEKYNDFEIRKAIDCAINTLPSNLQTCLKLRYGYKPQTSLISVPDHSTKNSVLTYGEISEHSHLEEKVIKTNVAKAKRKLRNETIINAIFKNLGYIKTAKSKYPALEMLINKELAYTLKGFGIIIVEDLSNLTKNNLEKIIDLHINKTERPEMDKQLLKSKYLSSLNELLTKYNLTFKPENSLEI